MKDIHADLLFCQQKTRLKTHLAGAVLLVVSLTSAYCLYKATMDPEILEMRPVTRTEFVYEDTCYWTYDRNGNRNLVSGSCEIQRQRDIEMGRKPFNSERN